MFIEKRREETKKQVVLQLHKKYEQSSSKTQFLRCETWYKKLNHPHQAYKKQLVNMVENTIVATCGGGGVKRKPYNTDLLKQLHYLTSDSWF